MIIQILIMADHRENQINTTFFCSAMSLHFNKNSRISPDSAFWSFVPHFKFMINLCSVGWWYKIKYESSIWLKFIRIKLQNHSLVWNLKAEAIFNISEGKRCGFFSWSESNYWMPIFLWQELLSFVRCSGALRCFAVLRLFWSSDGAKWEEGIHPVKSFYVPHQNFAHYIGLQWRWWKDNDFEQKVLNKKSTGC